VDLFAPLRQHLDHLVHPCALQHPLHAARHRAFIAPRLIGCVAILAVFPVYLAIRGAGSAIELMLFASAAVVMVVPAYFLSRSGRCEGAQVLSSVGLTALATAAAALTGGGTVGFPAVWLVLVPLEAALGGSRRAVAAALILAFAAAALLMLFGVFGPSRPPDHDGYEKFIMLGVAPAVFYAAALAFSLDGQTRTASNYVRAVEERYALLADNTDDLITRHDRDGAVLFASAAGRSLFGCGLADLQGHGLSARVHEDDRPAFLRALADAASLRESRSLEFRARRECGVADSDAAGQVVCIEMRCRPLAQEAPDEDSRYGGEVVAVLRDVSERKRQQNELEAALAHAEQAEAFGARLIAQMNDNLRSPLNAIVELAALLTKEPAPTSQAAQSEPPTAVAPPANLRKKKSA
jgi:two-component system, cell cycle sensor histidine kinase DivJ